MPNLQQNAEVCKFLKSFGVNWTSSLETVSDDRNVSDFKKILSESVYTECGQLDTLSNQTCLTLPKGVDYKVNLRLFLKEKELEGYDTNLNVALGRSMKINKPGIRAFYYAGSCSVTRAVSESDFFHVSWHGKTGEISLNVKFKKDGTVVEIRQ